MAMAMTRVTGRGPKSPGDEEFLQQLHRGGELLAQGKLAEARQLLERAQQLHPHHEKGRNLLGLAYFKLGLFDRAAEVYEALVRDNPVDATLRVNLGLVYLKTKALQRAMREFESATDLQPGYKKAHNYLGLALAQAGEYGRAREHFLQAGSDAMADKMARAMAGERFAQPARTVPAPASASRSGSAALTASEPPPEESLEDAIPEMPSKLMGFRPGTDVPVLSNLLRAVALTEASRANPFRVGNGGFAALVDGELLTRLEGLVAFSGQLQFLPEVRRFKGRASEQPFGEGARRLVRASGQGMIFIESAEARSFLAVELGDDGAYFREECLFAFEESVSFENGKVPSADEGPNLELVHLLGQGRVLLGLDGTLRSVAIGQESPVTVPLSHLVGWQGKVTPRMVPLGEAGSESSWVAVELSGEGFALIVLPVR
jgi:tetratricopeptide (TPR) repeat protein